ncbi:MAG TPA: hypothetical protein VF982_10330 [Anaerolineales bacterium]
MITLNRLLHSLHAIDLIEGREVILRVLARGTRLSGLVFAIFAFSQLVRVQFASFQIFGGLVFLSPEPHEPSVPGAAGLSIWPVPSRSWCKWE